MFKAVRNKESDFLFEKSNGSGAADIFFLAWTTTPWTLPSNLGLTVGPEIEYVLVHSFNPYTHLPVFMVLAKSLLGKYFKPEDENVILQPIGRLPKSCPGRLFLHFPVPGWRTANTNN